MGNRPCSSVVISTTEPSPRVTCTFDFCRFASLLPEYFWCDSKISRIPLLHRLTDALAAELLPYGPTLYDLVWGCAFHRTITNTNISAAAGQNDFVFALIRIRPSLLLMRISFSASSNISSPAPESLLFPYRQKFLSPAFGQTDLPFLQQQR